MSYVAGRQSMVETANQDFNDLDKCEELMCEERNAWRFARHPALEMDCIASHWMCTLYGPSPPGRPFLSTAGKGVSTGI